MKTRTFKLLLLACMLIAGLAPSDRNGEMDKVKKLFLAYHAKFPQEKMYVHQDKPLYVLGEDLFFKVYLMDAIFHGTLTPSQVVHVALLDPEQKTVAHRLLRIENGSAAGDIALSPDWSPGKYTLTAYTGYMRNFPDGFQFQRQIVLSATNAGDNSVPVDVSASADGAADPQQAVFSIQFLPEGGTMIEELPASLSFKAVDASGQGIEVTGIIKDQDGNRVAAFASVKFGLGFVSFTPLPGRRYEAVVDYKSRSKTVPLLYNRIT